MGSLKMYFCLKCNFYSGRKDGLDNHRCPKPGPPRARELQGGLPSLGKRR
jgi:hypothetical protein